MKRPSRIAAGVSLSLAVVLMTGAAAQATPIDDATPAATASENESSSDYSASLVLVDKDDSEPFAITEEQTVEDFLRSRGMEPSEYRLSDSKKLEADRVIDNGDELVLYKDQLSGKSEKVSLKAPKREKKTDELYEGERKVEAKGKDGTAVRTVVSYKLRSDTSSDDSIESSEERLTVLESPEAKVTLVGTKPRPVVEPESSSTTEVESETPEASPSSPSAGPRSQGYQDSSSDDSNSVSTEAPAGETSVPAEAIQLLKDQVGKPYVWGATGPDAFDCSGLVYWVYKTNYDMNIPRTASDQGHASTPVAREDIQPGDILWTSTHIGVYVGDGKIVHASNPRTGVKVATLDNWMAAGFKIGRF